MKRKLIAFAGPAGSGKSTAAEVLGGNILSFAAPLKKCLLDLFQFKPEQLYTLAGKEAVDERYGVSPRTVMQKFGTEFVREVVPNLWEILMKQELGKFSKESLVVIDDCRFPAEVDLVRNEGGVVVHITGRSLISSTHKSERGLKIYSEDIVIDNSSTLEDFKGAVSSLVK